MVVIVGPTGSGKSALAVALAKVFSGEVVNCDSVQIYRGLNIGTAKLSVQERHGIAHHLIDIANPSQLFTAGDFLTEGRIVLEQIRARRNLPIVAGGTGLYLRALLEGLFQGPKRSELLRKRLQKIAQLKGCNHLHQLLCRVDPSSCLRIAPEDNPKIIRALEVFFLTGLSLSQHWRSGRNALDNFEILKVGLNPPRDLLFKKIDRRVQQMLADGLKLEVQNLIASGVPENAKSLLSLGYAQMIRHLKGELDLEQTISAIQIATRHYAKRQLTWFRSEPEVDWFEGFGADPQIDAAVRGRVLTFLKECDNRRLDRAPA